MVLCSRFPPLHPLAAPNLLSASTDLPIQGSSYIWNYVIRGLFVCGCLHWSNILFSSTSFLLKVEKSSAAWTDYILFIHSSTVGCFWAVSTFAAVETMAVDIRWVGFCLNSEHLCSTAVRAMLLVLVLSLEFHLSSVHPLELAGQAEGQRELCRMPMGALWPHLSWDRKPSSASHSGQKLL